MNLWRQVLLRKQARPTRPATQVLAIAGEEVSITFRRHASARRFVLRLARDASGLVMTMPKRASLTEAMRFARASEGWIKTSMAKRQPRVAITAGALIPLRDIPCLIMPTGRVRGAVTPDIDLQVIHVPGGEAHTARRLIDWLKAEARADLEAASRKYANRMAVTFRKITVRDQKSRWGSCSTDGVLSYSWRLVLAPAFVLDYVAAHEVAHLREMNHSTRFWRLVLSHCERAREAKTWLKAHANELHRYGD